MSRVESRIEPSVTPSPRSPAQIERELRQRLRDGARLVCAGEARRRPARLLEQGYAPRYEVRLFGWTFWLAELRQNPNARFFVAYLSRDPATLHARILYKDGALVWRSASHFASSGRENWIGKGDVRVVVEDGVEFEETAEETSDLPLEIQTALERLSRARRRIPRDDDAFFRVLRRAPDGRIRAYRDFTEPRRRAGADPRNLVHGGRSVASFTRRGDPASLRFVRGYAPDFERGVLEVSESSSRLYGGRLLRRRVLSANRRIQYLFIAGPRQVWIASVQTTTTELSSYGVRTLEVVVDGDLLIPGQEYHYLDRSEDPPQLVSQIPVGYAGAQSEVEIARADASPWLDRLPVIQEFRRYFTNT